MYFNVVLQTQIEFLRKVFFSYPITYISGHMTYRVFYIYSFMLTISLRTDYFHVGYVYTVYIKKNATLIKNFVHHFLIRNALHFYGLPLDLCGKRIAALFSKHAAIFAHALQFGETCCIFTGKAPQSFTRRRTFRDNVKVRHTQRDKRSARYATLISAAAACLLHSF